MSTGFEGRPGSRSGEQPVWHYMSEAAGLISPEGAVQETIFGRMTQLAVAHDAVNLGQGAPGDPTPGFLIEATYDAMRQGVNQYAPAMGSPVLREAIAAHRQRDWGHTVDPSEVLITAGATEALTATIIALAPRDTDIVVLEPYYDSYAAAAALAGARLKPVGLIFDPAGVRVDMEALEDAITDRTSIVLVNTPHNPTGLIIGADDITRIWAMTDAVGAWMLTDEVYEHLVFDGKHVAPAAVIDSPRVITVSSAGKTFNATGWKIGWLIGSPQVLEAVRAVKQYLTYTNGAPMQPAIAAGLTEHQEFPRSNAQALAARRDALVPALRAIPDTTVWAPASGYFALVDFSAGTDEDAYTLNRRLTKEIGVTGIPAPALCAAGSPTSERLRSIMRYSFCKTDEDVQAAVVRLRALAQG